MPKRIWIFAALLSAALITSCGTTKLSRQDLSDVDAGKKAVVRTYNQPLLGTIIFEAQPVTQIIAVDGVKIDTALFKLDVMITVDVGSRDIEFNCVNRAGHDERDYTEIIQLDLKPHHEYLVRCSLDSDFGPDGSYTGSFSVEDKSLK